jgi:hypothetical protein
MMAFEHCSCVSHILLHIYPHPIPSLVLQLLQGPDLRTEGLAATTLDLLARGLAVIFGVISG